MRYWPVVAMIVFLLPAISSAGDRLTPRPLDELSAETFARARFESPTVRRLVAALERSNVIVHIVSSRDLRPGLAGTTRFVVSRGGYRYARITLHVELTARARTTILAHELQHACELAASDADDADSVRRLFEQAGVRQGDGFETRAAQMVERVVDFELRATAGVYRER